MLNISDRIPDGSRIKTKLANILKATTEQNSHCGNVPNSTRESYAAKLTVPFGRMFICRIHALAPLKLKVRGVGPQR